MLITGKSYEKCTACSKTVVSEYKQKGSEFLLRVFNNPMVLEELTGLDKMKAEVDDVEGLVGDFDLENDDF